jgi:hypothetical protein
MRRFVCLFAVLLVLGLSPAPSPAYADDGQYVRRPTVALLPVINNSGQRHTGYMVGVITEALNAKFPPERYLIVSGPVLEDALRQQGIDDFRTAGSYSLINALQAMGVDYYVRTEIQAVTTRQRVFLPDVFLLLKQWAATVPISFTVMNVRTGTVAYDATFSEYARNDGLVGFTDRHNAIRIGLSRVLDRFAQEQIYLE